MRRALALIGLIGLGVLLGFLIRLVWPRPNRQVPAVYDPPGSVPAASPSEVRRTP
jgi:hypothetical protein